MSSIAKLDAVVMEAAASSPPSEENTTGNSKRKKYGSIKDLMKFSVDASTVVQEDEPRIFIRDVLYACTNNVSMLTGLPKAGKTTVCIFILATALTPEDLGDTGFIKTTYCQGRPVIFIDTEQSLSTTKNLRKKVLTFAFGGHAESTSLVTYNIRHLSVEDKLEFVLGVMELHKNIHLLVVDGLADIIGDVNDSQRSIDIIHELQREAMARNICMVLYMHENSGSTNGKARGHVGSEMERKCFGTISVKKDRAKKVHVIESKLQRGGDDFDDIVLRYDETLGRMVTLDESEVETIKLKAEQEKVAKKMENLKKYVLLCFDNQAKMFATGKGISHTELCNKILDCSKSIEGKTISERTAKERIKQLLDAQLVEKVDGMYLPVKNQESKKEQ